MKQNRKKRKIKVFADLKQSLGEALEYEQGKKSALRVSELPPPPRPLSVAKFASSLSLSSDVG